MSIFEKNEEELKKLSKIILHEKTSKNLTLNEVNLAIKHGVASILFDSIDKTSLNDDVAQERLKKYYFANEVRSTLLIKKANELFDILNSNQVKYVVLKGYSLSNSLYIKPNLRQYADIDLIIDKKQKELVKSLFKKKNFTNPIGWEPASITNQISFRFSILEGVYLDFDVHLKLLNNKKLENLYTFSELQKGSIYYQSTDTSLYLVNHVDALIHASFHLLHNFYKKDPIKLIWLYDIYLLVESIEDIEQLIVQVKKKSAVRILQLAISQTIQYFYSPKAKALYSNLIAHEADDLILSYLIHQNKFSRFVMEFREMKGMKNKLKYVRELTFPPTIELKKKYGEFRPILLPYYYIKRLIFGLIKSLKKL